MGPRIAIPIPTSTDDAYNRLSWQAYADAIHSSGCEPVAVALTSSGAELSELYQAVKGVLLPGSRFDVEPAGYGQPRDEDCAPPDPRREFVDHYFLEQAERTAKPLLGICFGMQMINVFYSGTMVQDLAVLPVNHAAGRSVLSAHTVAVAPDSCLLSSIGHAELEVQKDQLRLPVNSSHHQAAAIAGQGLRVVARCPQDGVIEAVERVRGQAKDGERFLLGVQWHPERTFTQSASSRGLFRKLIEEAAAWQL